MTCERSYDYQRYVPLGWKVCTNNNIKGERVNVNNNGKLDTMFLDFSLFIIHEDSTAHSHSVSDLQKHSFLCSRANTKHTFISIHAIFLIDVFIGYNIFSLVEYDWILDIFFGAVSLAGCCQALRKSSMYEVQQQPDNDVDDSIRRIWEIWYKFD